MSAEEVRARVTFTCPFCGRVTSVAESVAERTPPMLLHELPMCAEFERLTPEEYFSRCVDARLDAAARSAGGKQNGGAS